MARAAVWHERTAGDGRPFGGGTILQKGGGPGAPRKCGRSAGHRAPRTAVSPRTHASGAADMRCPRTAVYS
jgi:hypothetical protein